MATCSSKKGPDVLKKYNKFIFDPVTIYLLPDAQKRGFDPDDMERLAKYFHDAVAEELAKSGRYEIVTIPGPDVLELNVTEQARAKTLQGQIWSETVAASALPGVRPDAARFRKESR